jgi:hypothetical protein
VACGKSYGKFFSRKNLLPQPNYWKGGAPLILTNDRTGKVPELCFRGRSLTFDIPRVEVVEAWPGREKYFCLLSRSSWTSRRDDAGWEKQIFLDRHIAQALGN